MSESRVVLIWVRRKLSDGGLWRWVLMVFRLRAVLFPRWWLLVRFNYKFHSLELSMWTENIPSWVLCEFKLFFTWHSLPWIVLLAALYLAPRYKFPSFLLRYLPREQEFVCWGRYYVYLGGYPESACKQMNWGQVNKPDNSPWRDFFFLILEILGSWQDSHYADTEITIDVIIRACNEHSAGQMAHQIVGFRS